MILILVILILIWNIHTLKGNFNRKAYFFLIFSILLNTLYILIYRYELTILNREVYFSDAQAYYDKGLYLIHFGIHQPIDLLGYKFIVYLILKYGLLKSPAELNIVNLLLFYNAILFILRYVISKVDVNHFKINLLLFLILFNPLITFSLFRNLKDATFFFFVGYLLWINSNKNFSNEFKIVVNIILTLYLPSIRPWAFILPFSLFSIEFLLKRDIKLKFSNILIIGMVSFLLVAVVWYFKGNYILLWINYLNYSDPGGAAKTVGLGLTNRLMGPFRLLLGPGPYRPLFASIYYKYHIPIGDFLSEVGIVFWYMFLSVFTVKVLSVSKIRLKQMSALLFVLSCYLIIYAFAYSGAVEIRFRGQIFPLVIFLFVFARNTRLKNNTFNVFVTYIVFLLISMVSILISK